MSGWMSPLKPDSPVPSSQSHAPVGTPFFDDHAQADVHDGVVGPIKALPMLGWIDSADSAPPMPTSLDPNAPRKMPAVDGGPLDPAEGGYGSNPGYDRRYSARPGGKFEGVDHTAVPYSSGIGLDDRLKDFDAEAAQLSTPEQMKMLEERYRR